MEILVYSIQKDEESFKNEINNYIKMSSRWAKIGDINKFSDKISKAQSNSKTLALQSYNQAYMPCLQGGYNIILDENGKDLNSMEFANLLQDRSKISFFIGGAYGFSQDIKNMADATISLSRLTTSHSIAKLMLYEQIFRGLCINAGHPYHK